MYHNGIKFDSFDEAEKRLNDYGCLHFKTPIICGISEPTYSEAELARLKQRDKQTFDIDGKQMTGYEASQAMRRLETGVREQKAIREAAKQSGDVLLERRCTERIKAYQSKYNEISDITGIDKEPKRMSIPRGTNTIKSVDFSGESGIIDSYKGNGLSVSSNALVTEETKQRVIDATKTITSDFKALENYSEPIKFGDTKGGLAVNNYDPATGKNQITLSRDGFSDTKNLLELLKKDFYSGVSYDTDLVESLVAHEMGHNAHIALVLKRIGAEYGKPLNAIQRDLFAKEFMKIRTEIYEAAFTNESEIEIFSKCAKELGTKAFGANELIAQSFGNYYYGKEKSPIAKKIVMYFKKGLK